MKKLIINADDFGLSSSVNRGIVDCFQRGVVSSTTLMANMSGFDDAVLLAQENSGLKVGAHLNVYRGRPLSPAREIASLVNKNGMFYASVELPMRLYLGKVKIEHIEKELRAQVVRIREAGVQITHFDSEKHFHMFPVVSQAVLNTARYFGIKKIRLPQEKRQSGSFNDLFSAQFCKYLYLSLRAKKMRGEFQRAGILYVDNFFGILYSKKIGIDAFLQILERIPEGVSEIMVHPGYVDSELRQMAKEYNNYLLETREEEVKVLTSEVVVEKVKELSIKLVGYDEL